MKNKYISSIIAVLLLMFTVTFSVSVPAYAVPSGCYLGEGNGDRTYTSTTCPSEGVGRAVSQFETCVVVLTGGGYEERNCDALEESSNKIPESSTFTSNNSGDASPTPNSGLGRDELGSGECDVPDGAELSRDNCEIINLIVVGINFLSAVAGIAIVFSLMFAGYQYMTSRDNAGQVQKAKIRIVWTLVSLGLFIFMYALLNFLVPGGVL